MYKLVCIDMDGTLLNKNHLVSEENKETLKKATELGVNIAISTGRVFASARIYANITGIKAPLICSNGSYVREKDNDLVIFKSVLDETALNSIYDIVKKHKFLAYFDTPYGIISDSKIPDDDSHRIMNEWVDDEDKIKFYEFSDFKEAFNIYKDDILKVIIIETENSSKIYDVKEEINKINKGADIVYSWSGCVEIMAKGTSKGNAVKCIAKRLNIKKEEIMCIGDSGNDLSMFKESGLAVVMGNASDDIKRYADYVTDTNENNGVSKAIKKFILEKKD
ncbi:Cof-type HAD-IIB family hydrolase [Clostridium sp. Ade.TY]|uniref:Cof-type HAD-IIB family hydrolase n=1 Tax=Clostridium sp. Ade.TY TaxID=1391647 RepID=UPI00041738D2|nr:Cof-type HAD-IIB family hydrolase [Clostridium sp. Ade.TY]